VYVSKVSNLVNMDRMTREFLDFPSNSITQLFTASLILFKETKSARYKLLKCLKLTLYSVRCTFIPAYSESSFRIAKNAWSINQSTHVGFLNFAKNQFPTLGCTRDPFLHWKCFKTCCNVILNEQSSIFTPKIWYFYEYDPGRCQKLNWS